MHILFVAPTLPDPFTGGGGNWLSVYIDQLKSRHKISIVAVLGKHAYDKARISEIQTKLEAAGIGVTILPFTPPPVTGWKPWRVLKKLTLLALGEYWQVLADCSCAPTLNAEVNKLKPDVLFCAAHLSAYFAHDIDNFPKVACLAEGFFVNRRTTMKFNILGTDLKSILRRKKELFISYLEEHAEILALRKFSLLGFMGMHYVRWAELKKIPNAVLVSTPVPDAGMVKAEFHSTKSKCFRILMIGHLHSTSNKTQLPLLAEMLPDIERRFAGIDVKIRIVGNNHLMPKEFDFLRKHPLLDFVGPKYPAETEFLSADVIFVPVPAETGSRVRIIQAFSLGCPVVGHDANQLGIAEILDGGNILLSGTSSGLVDKLFALYSDPELAKRLGASGRKTYEAAYTPKYASEVMEYWIQEAVERFKAEQQRIVIR